jgi:hypothetical protein
VFFWDIESGTKLVSELLGVLPSVEKHQWDSLPIFGLPSVIGNVFVDEGHQFFIPLRSEVLGDVNLAKSLILRGLAVSDSPPMVCFFLSVRFCLCHVSPLSFCQIGNTS